MSGVAVFRFWCDGCNSTIEVSSELAGIPSNCSKCGESFLIPKKSTPEVQSMEAEPISEPMGELPQATRANQAWWIAVIFGGLSSVASFFAGGGGTLVGGLIAVALNPFYWLGLWAFFARVNPDEVKAKCPHCAKWVDIKQFTGPALSEIQCPECPNKFLKPPA